MRKIFLTLLLMLVAISAFGQQVAIQKSDEQFDPSSGFDPATGCKLWTVVGGSRRVSDDKPDTREKLLEKYMLMKDLIIAMGYDFEVVYERAQKGIGLQLINYSADEAPETYKRSTYSLDQKTPRLTSGCVKPAWKGREPLWHQTFDDLKMPLPPLDTYVNCSNTSASGELPKITLDVPKPPPVYGIDIDKTVRNLTLKETEFRNVTRARPRDRAQFRLHTEVTGNAVQDNVMVSDALQDKRLIFVQGSVIINVNGKPAPSGNIFGTGYNFGNHEKATIEILFEADVADESQFTRGELITLDNIAWAQSDQAGSDESTATVTVFLERISLLPPALKPPPPTIIQPPAEKPPGPPSKIIKILTWGGIAGAGIVACVFFCGRDKPQPPQPEAVKGPGVLGRH